MKKTIATNHLLFCAGRHRYPLQLLLSTRSRQDGGLLQMFSLAKGQHNGVQHDVLRVQHIVNTLDVAAFNALFQVGVVVARVDPKFRGAQVAPAR